MIDEKDASDSTLRLILWQALGNYPTERLLELLCDPDAIVRTAAAKQLHLRPSQIVFERAVTLISSSKSYLREIAAFLLGQLGTPKMTYKGDSVLILTKVVREDRSGAVRSTAVAALGHLSASEATDTLLKAAQDRSEKVRLSVAFALGRVSASEEVVRTLKKLARDRNAEVRDWARLSIGVIKEQRMSA